jgi:hypothetical protein
MRIAYLQRSLKRFLAGTNCKTPSKRSNLVGAAWPIGAEF